MSKADSIQRKLDKAYGKVAQTLGREFEVFRPSGLNNPLVSANYMFTEVASFSQDEKYKTKSKAGLSIWSAWINSQLGTLFELRNGDMLYNQSDNETYIMVGMEPHLTHQAIKADNRISVIRSGESGYGDNDGTGFAPGNSATDSLIAENVPCQIIESSSYGASGYIPVQNNTEDTLPRMDIFLWDLFSEIITRDKIVDENGNVMEVQVVTKTDIGTKLRVRGVPQ